MKILLINYKYFIAAGTERYLFNIKEIFERRGHEVIPFSLKSSRNVHTPYEPDFAASMGGQDTFLFQDYRMTPRLAFDVVDRLFYSLPVRRKLEQLIRKTRPDVAYVIHHYNKMSPSVIDACKRHGLPVVQRLSDFFLLCPQAHFYRNGGPCEACIETGYGNAVRYRCVRNSVSASVLKFLAITFQRYMLKVYDRVDAYVCTTRFMKRKMVKGGFDPDKLAVIPTFVSPRLFSRGAGSDRPLDDEKKYILFFGRFTPEKGIDVLIRGFARSKLYQDGVGLVLIGGTADFLHRYQFTAHEEDIIRRYVTLHDFLPAEQLEDHLDGCLFVVHPTRWYENLPNVILESYCRLKPVISANIGSIPEVVMDRRTGLLYHGNDAGDLAKQMNRLYHDTQLQSQMKENIAAFVGRRNAETHYGQLIRLFESVQTGKRKRM